MPHNVDIFLKILSVQCCTVVSVTLNMWWNKSKNPRAVTVLKKEEIFQVISINVKR